MREVGYDFYEIKVLDKAFKNGVKILNRVGKGFSPDGIDNDMDRRGISYAMGDEMMNFDDDEDFQLIDSLK